MADPGRAPDPDGVDPPIAFTVNGRAATAHVAGSTPLLYVLRNDLGLKGTRFGCGTALCGACMVIVDGRAQPSCDVPLEAVEGRDVRTVEGLASGDVLDPLQQALIDEVAGQCGFCLSGILMSARALLDADPHPDEAAIRTALEPNICRCGAHARVLRAVMRVAAETP